MLNGRLAFALIASAVLLVPTRAQASISVRFHLSTAATTSAGVFDRDGTLVRTLWSGVHRAAGEHTADWDGLDDGGHLASDGPYEVRILSDDVRYTWEGVVGNTSDRFTGPTLYHAYDIILGMAVAGSSIYLATGYNEGATSAFKTTTADPQQRISILGAGLRTGAITCYVTTDGTNVYWSGSDAFIAENSFVYVTRVSDDREASLAKAVPIPVTYGRTYHSAIDRVGGAGSTITGIAVQHAGPYLFVARSALDRLDVVNKSTGAVIRTLRFPHPTALVADGNDDLWMVLEHRTVTKYHVGFDGSLRAITRISGFSEALALAVSPDNRTLAVADAGSAQQVEGFDNTATFHSVRLWTLGEAGGYANGPDITDDKFYFHDFTDITFKPHGTDWTFLAYQPDGSLWVGDSGNDRSERFGTGRTVLDRIQYIPGFYSVSADPKDPSRVFANLLEFHVDYSKPLGPHNGSWTLVRNWGWGVPARLLDNESLLKWIATLPNGRTYATLGDDTARKLAIVELPPRGNLRLTGIETPTRSYAIEPDGSLHSVTTCPDSPIVWRVQSLTGFDPDHNPEWAAARIVGISPKLTPEDVCTHGWAPWPTTSSGLILAYGEFSDTGGWHIEALDPATGQWRWKAAPSTNVNYVGSYPNDGHFDIGNNVNAFAGGDLHTSGHHVFWEYHGEKWKNGQTNVWTHLYDDGLMVGQFGVVDPARSLPEGAAEMAGNAFSSALVTARDGSLYLYQNDESFHGGIHRWHITGLASIREQRIPVSVSSNAAPGLLETYFRGSDLDNVKTVARRIVSCIDFDPGSTTPSGFEPMSLEPFSVRWSGFVQPAYSEIYTFSLQSSGGVRLWIDHTLVIDRWTDPGSAPLSGSIPLTAGVRYPIRLEYYGRSGRPLARLSWSSESQPSQTVPASRLWHASAGRSPRPGGIPLLDGLAYATPVRADLYGWHRSPANDSTNDFVTDWWQVHTSAFTYSGDEPGDISARWTARSGEATLSRDLLPTEAGPVGEWTLAGQVACDFFPNQKEYGQAYSSGLYIDVLDDAGKVIARLDSKLFAYPNDIRVLGNGGTIARMGLKRWNTEFIGAQKPFGISAQSGRVRFRLAGGVTLTTSPFDPESDWRRPRTLRLLFWQTGIDYPRTVDLREITFSAR